MDRYEDCEICGERFEGDDIATHMREVTTARESYWVCDPPCREGR